MRLTDDSTGFMPFRALNLSPKILQAVHDAGYTEPGRGDPAHSRGTRCHWHRANRHGKNRGFRLADFDEARGVDAQRAKTDARSGSRADARAGGADRREFPRLCQTYSVAHGHGLRWSERTSADRRFAIGCRSCRSDTGPVDRSDGSASGQSFGDRVSRARRSGSNARHGFSSTDSTDRESVAAETADANVLRVALA